MKKVLQHLLILSLFSGILTSCSQQQSLVKQEEPTSYKYKKVYIGNRIVYRENPEVIESKLPVMSNSVEKALTEKRSLRKPSNIQEPLSYKASKKSRTTKKNKSQDWFGVNAHNGMRLTTDFWAMHNNADDRVQNDLNTQQTESLRSVFGIIGFILGLIGILGFISANVVGIGIGAAILGIIFSFLGLKSELSDLSYVGLILSIIVLVLLIII